MEEQTTAYSTQAALCMHRGWVGITSASTVLPWYLQFPSLHLHTGEWEGFDWDNISSILQIPQGVNSTGNITFTYMTELETTVTELELKSGFLQSYYLSCGLPGSASPHCTGTSRNPFVLPLPLLFPPKPDE